MIFEIVRDSTEFVRIRDVDTRVTTVSAIIGFSKPYMIDSFKGTK